MLQLQALEYGQELPLQNLCVKHNNARENLERSRKMDKSFAYNLKLARLRCGFTQQDMSDRLNINRTTYTKWETDKSEPSIENIKMLVKILEISYDYLFSEANRKDGEKLF
mgnify:FL=1